MSFNPDPSKQAQEVIFSRKIKKPSHPDLIFNNNKVIQTPYQKHLGMFLGDKLNFGEHLKCIANKVNKSIGLLRKLQKLLPRPSLVTIYKSFTRPYIDYGDTIFDQTYIKSFYEKVDIFQCNTLLAITGAIRGTPKEKLHQELRFESLQHRIDNCFVNSVLSLRFSKIILPVIFMSYYLLKAPLATQDHLMIYSFFILDIIFSKICFFLLQ